VQLLALLSQHGVLIVFAVTLAARIGAPLPAAPMLVVAGGLASAGQFSGLGVFVVSVLANLAGDAVWFWSGRHHGHRVMRLLCRISMSPDSCVRQSESLILRWGGHSLIAAKFVPGVSVVAAPMAGALAMPWPRFLGFDLVAAALWTVIYLGLGMVFTEQIQQILDVMASTGAVALGLLVLVLAALLALRYWRRRSFLSEVDMPRISVGELRALMREGDPPIVVDVRSAASVDVDDRGIPGALRIGLDEVEHAAASLSREREIVVYCNCPNEVSAARAARVLMAQGFRRVRPLAGGLDAWVAGVAPGDAVGAERLRA
jgi:membrane protein DedA with SNARE-associated domain/rhodanese-related sulfurtransferase